MVGGYRRPHKKTELIGLEGHEKHYELLAKSVGVREKLRGKGALLWDLRVF